MMEKISHLERWLYIIFLFKVTCQGELTYASAEYWIRYLRHSCWPNKGRWASTAGERYYFEEAESDEEEWVWQNFGEIKGIGKIINEAWPCTRTRTRVPSLVPSSILDGTYIYKERSSNTRVQISWIDVMGFPHLIGRRQSRYDLVAVWEVS